MERKEKLPESHLLDVLHVMLGGYKDHRLLLGLHHVPEQMKQQRRLVVHTREEK